MMFLVILGIMMLLVYGNENQQTKINNEDQQK